MTSYARHDLDKFRDLQQLAYRCATQVASTLDEGVTERQAAARLRDALLAAGADDFFHVPFAWFGDRTAFRHFRSPLQFFPTRRALADGMPYVLDCAPVKDGYVADIGYSGVLGENPLWEKMNEDLSEYREFIRAEVAARKPLDDIYAGVDALIARHGYRNRHRVYPGRVIGHQVTRLPAASPGMGRTMFGFGVRTLQTLGREIISERIAGRSPLWADRKSSRHPPTPGLWAVEPHIGLAGTGMKFEELLVVTGGDVSGGDVSGGEVYWLDDDLPHVHRWQTRKPARKPAKKADAQ